jgi:hypothetical protein
MLVSYLALSSILKMEVIFFSEMLDVQTDYRLYIAEGISLHNHPVRTSNPS